MSLACGILSPRGSSDGLSGTEHGFGVSVMCLWGGAVEDKSGPKPKIILKGFEGRSYGRSGFCQQGRLLCFPKPLAGQGFAKPVSSVRGDNHIVLRTSCSENFPASSHEKPQCSPDLLAEQKSPGFSCVVTWTCPPILGASGRTASVPDGTGEVPELTYGAWCPGCGLGQAAGSVWLRAAVDASHSGRLPRRCQRMCWGGAATGMGDCPEETQEAPPKQ